MSQDNMELNYADKTTFLNFWDSLHGNDIVFQITPDQAYRQEWAEGESEPTLIPVNLCEELVNLSIKIKKEAFEADGMTFNP